MPIQLSLSLDCDLGATLAATLRSSSFSASAACAAAINLLLLSVPSPPSLLGLFDHLCPLILCLEATILASSVLAVSRSSSSLAALLSLSTGSSIAAAAALSAASLIATASLSLFSPSCLMLS